MGLEASLEIHHAAQGAEVEGVAQGLLLQQVGVARVAGLQEEWAEQKKLL